MIINNKIIMNNTHYILQHKMGAKKSYDYLLKVHNETKDIKCNNEKLCYKICKAQLTIYAGIYNRDYKEYKKGVDMFADASKKYNELPECAAILRIKENEAIQERDSMDMPEWFNYKYNYYKNLYNILPRGYFKKK